MDTPSGAVETPSKTAGTVAGTGSSSDEGVEQTEKRSSVQNPTNERIMSPTRIMGPGSGSKPLTVDRGISPQSSSLIRTSR